MNTPVRNDRAESSDHAIYLLFDFPRYTETASWRLSQMIPVATAADCPTGLIHPARRDPAAKVHRLFETGIFDVSADLHPAAIAALHPDEIPRALSGPKCLRLSPIGKAIMNGDWVRPAGRPDPKAGYRASRGLHLPLGKDSVARIVAAGVSPPAEVALMVLDVAVLRLSDDLGLAILELRVSDPSLPVLQEVMHVLTHGGRTAALRWACEDPPSHGFSVADLVGALLHGCDCRPEVWNRIYAYCFALESEMPADAEAIVWRLSRHYTSAYHPGVDQWAGGTISRGFADVLHGSGIEGAATLVAAASPFLATAFHDRVRRAYLPLVVLAYQEHVQLLHLAQGIGTTRPAALRRMIDRFLRLRLKLRLPVVSEVTAHNLFYEALRHGLQADALTRKILYDATQAERRLRDLANQHRQADRLRASANQHRQERAYAPVVGLFAGMLTFLTTHTALKELIEGVELADKLPHWLPVVVATILALVSGVVTGDRHRIAHRHGGADEESELDEEIEIELQTESIHVVAERQS